MRESERVRESETDRDRDTDTDRHRQTQTDRHRQTDRSKVFYQQLQRTDLTLKVAFHCS